MLQSFVDTRVLIDYEQFAEMLDEGVVICTNAGVLGAIRVLIRSYGLRNVNWATSYSEAGYIGVTPEQFDIIDNQISIFLGETNDMGFCEDLTQAMNNLSASFQAGCCGSGSFGAGQAEPASSPYPDQDPDWPPGFDTYAEYRSYKCDIANRIIEGVREDMDWLAAGTLTTLVGSVLVGALFTPIPFDDILALVGFAVSLLLQGVLSATAASVSATIASERQTLVCLLYDADDAISAKAVVTAYLGTLLTTTEAGLFALVWSFAGVNGLFTKNILMDASPLPSAVSCDACTSECELVVSSGDDFDVLGVFTEISETVIDVVSGLVQPGPKYWGICDFNTKPGPFPQFYCGPTVEVATYDLVGFTPTATLAFRLYGAARTLIYSSSTPPDWSLYPAIRSIQLQSTTAWTGTITLV